MTLSLVAWFVLGGSPESSVFCSFWCTFQDVELHARLHCFQGVEPSRPSLRSFQLWCRNLSRGCLSDKQVPKSLLMVGKSNESHVLPASWSSCAISKHQVSLSGEVSLERPSPRGRLPKSRVLPWLYSLPTWRILLHVKSCLVDLSATTTANLWDMMRPFVPDRSSIATVPGFKHINQRKWRHAPQCEAPKLHPIGLMVRVSRRWLARGTTMMCFSSMAPEAGARCPTDPNDRLRGPMSQSERFFVRLFAASSASLRKLKCFPEKKMIFK